MKRHLNTIKNFFDGRAAALSEVLVPSGKGQVLVLRTQSTTDVVESNDENPDSTEITNSIQLPPKQLSKSVDDVGVADYDMNGASGVTTAKDGMAGLSKSTEAILCSTDDESVKRARPARVPSNVSAAVAGSSQHTASPNLDSTDFFSDDWSSPAATLSSSLENAELDSQDLSSPQPDAVSEIDLGVISAGSTGCLSNAAALHRRNVRPPGRRVQTQYLSYINFNGAAPLSEITSQSPTLSDPVTILQSTSFRGDGTSRTTTDRVDTRKVPPAVAARNHVKSQLIDLNRSRPADETSGTSKEPEVTAALSAQQGLSSSLTQENREKPAAPVTKSDTQKIGQNGMSSANSSTSDSKEELPEPLPRRQATAGIALKPPPVAAKRQPAKPESSMPPNADLLRRFSGDVLEEKVSSGIKVTAKKTSAPEMMTTATDSSVANESKVQDSFNKTETPNADLKTTVRPEVKAEVTKQNDAAQAVEKSDVISEAKADATVEDAGNSGKASKPLANLNKVEQNATRDKTEVSRVQVVLKDDSKLGLSKAALVQKSERSLVNSTKVGSVDVEIMNPSDGLKKKVSADAVVTRNVQQISSDQARKMSDSTMVSRPGDKQTGSQVREITNPKLSNPGSSGNSPQIDLSTPLKEERSAVLEAADKTETKVTITSGSSVGTSGILGLSTREKPSATVIPTDESKANGPSRMDKQKVGKLQSTFLKGDDVKENRNVSKPVGRLPGKAFEDTMVLHGEKAAASITDSSESDKVTLVLSQENKNKQIEDQVNPGKLIVSSLPGEKTVEQSVAMLAGKRPSAKETVGESSSAVREEIKKTSNGKAKPDTVASDNTQSVAVKSVLKRRSPEEATSELAASNARVPVTQGIKTDLKSTGKLSSELLSSGKSSQEITNDATGQRSKSVDDKSIAMTNSRPKFGQNDKSNVESDDVVVMKESESTLSSQVPKKTANTGESNKNPQDKGFTSPDEASVQKVEGTKMLVKKLPNETSSSSNVPNAFNCNLRPAGANTKLGHKSLFLPSTQSVDSSVESTSSVVKSGRTLTVRAINRDITSRPISHIDTSGLIGRNPKSATLTESNKETLPPSSTSSKAVDGSSELPSNDLSPSSVILSGGESKPSSILGKAGSQMTGTKSDSSSGSAGKLKSSATATSSLTVNSPVSSSLLKDKEAANANDKSLSKGAQQRSAGQQQTSASSTTRKTSAEDKAESAMGHTVKTSNTVASSTSSHKTSSNKTGSNTDKLAGSKESVDQSSAASTSEAKKVDVSSAKAASTVKSTTLTCPSVVQDSSSENKASTPTVEPASANVGLVSGLTAKKFTRDISNPAEPSWMALAKQRKQVWTAGNS